jgi:hypothetical protein
MGAIGSRVKAGFSGNYFEGYEAWLACKGAAHPVMLDDTSVMWKMWEFDDGADVAIL